tara:strand:+ start:4742 stop:6643 length:1902 start_codon:yes stop_codon:yes gene_type:complete
MADFHIITGFDLGVQNVSFNGDAVPFSIFGDNGSTFSLEVYDDQSSVSWYDWEKKKFTTTKKILSGTIKSNKTFIDQINFGIGVMSGEYSAAVVYKVILTAKQTGCNNTKFAKYIEILNEDKTVNLNASIGSNTNQWIKEIKQGVRPIINIGLIAPTLADSGESWNGATLGSLALTTELEDSVNTSFSITATAGSGKSIQIYRQPEASDICTFKNVVIGASGTTTISDEDIWSEDARAAFTGDDINGAITSGAIIQIDGTVASNVNIGDRITTAVTTDTVNGARDTSAVAVTMDSAVATKMAVGDRVTGNAELDAAIFTVASLDSTNVFSISPAVAIADGVTLTFSSLINREVVTVASLDPSSGTAHANKFTISQSVQFRDNCPLTFTEPHYFRWPVTNVVGLGPGLSLDPNNTTINNDTTIATYGTLDEIYFEKQVGCETIIERRILPKISSLAVETTSPFSASSYGKITTQAGNIVLSSKQGKSFESQTVRVFAYGTNQIKTLSFGTEIIFSNLKAEIADANIITTTINDTDCTGSASLTVFDVTSSAGIMDDVSTVRGVNISPSAVNPTVTNISTNTLTISSAQTLQNTQTLHFDGASNVITITGDIEIKNTGFGNADIFLDVEKFLICG